MGFLEEYALMGAIALPIVVVAASNVYLALTGESGTLLLPGPSRFETRASVAEGEDSAESTAPGGA
jgi:hypothetical protein